MVMCCSQGCADADEGFARKGVGHVRVKALDQAPGIVQEEHGVVIPVEEPLEGVAKVPVGHSISSPIKPHHRQLVVLCHTMQKHSKYNRETRSIQGAVCW